MLKLSIIIPVFNTSFYLNKCLTSCLNQDIDKNEYEIITIDDGSTDDSVAVIRSIQENNTNIILITKDNGGVSSARNAGIEAAKGKYILFVDSDDTIEENSFNAIVKEFENKNIELIILNSIIYKNEIKIKETYKFPQQLTGKTLSGIELFKKEYSRGSVCGVVFNKQFIYSHELRFSEKIKNGEDSLFMACTFLYASLIIHLDLDFYKVNSREESASQCWNYKKVKVMLNNLKEIDYLINNKPLTTNQLSILNIHAYSIISNSLFYFFSINHLNKYFEVRKLIRNSKLYPIKTYGAKHFRFKIILLNFSIDLFSFTFLIRQLFNNLRRIYLSLFL
jgi:glycosyltransferase involved in cell wall biosynthesis